MCGAHTASPSKTYAHGVAERKSTLEATRRGCGSSMPPERQNSCTGIASMCVSSSREYHDHLFTQAFKTSFLII